QTQAADVGQQPCCAHSVGSCALGEAGAGSASRGLGPGIRRGDRPCWTARDELIRAIGRLRRRDARRRSHGEPSRRQGSDVTPGAWVPDRRDIIWIDCNPQAGREMRDLHPMLVLSPRNFNERTSIVIGLPMTTPTYNDDNPFAVKVTGPRNVTGYVLCHQPKSFDWRARKAKAHP